MTNYDQAYDILVAEKMKNFTTLINDPIVIDELKHDGEAKNMMLNFVIKHLFNGICVDDVYQVVQESKIPLRHRIIMDGNKISEVYQNTLAVEADTILSLPTWKIVMERAKYFSNKKMFEESKGNDDMVAGKMMLYAYDVLEKMLKNLTEMRLTVTPQINETYTPSHGTRPKKRTSAPAPSRTESTREKIV